VSRPVLGTHLVPGHGDDLPLDEFVEGMQPFRGRFTLRDQFQRLRGECLVALRQVGQLALEPDGSLAPRSEEEPTADGSIEQAAPGDVDGGGDGPHRRRIGPVRHRRDIADLGQDAGLGAVAPLEDIDVEGPGHQIAPEDPIGDIAVGKEAHARQLHGELLRQRHGQPRMDAVLAAADRPADHIAVAHVGNGQDHLGGALGAALDDGDHLPGTAGHPAVTDDPGSRLLDAAARGEAEMSRCQAAVLGVATRYTAFSVM
jgi:hypothetical protein